MEHGKGYSESNGIMHDLNYIGNMIDIESATNYSGPIEITTVCIFIQLELFIEYRSHVSNDTNDFIDTM